MDALLAQAADGGVGAWPLVAAALSGLGAGGVLGFLVGRRAIRARSRVAERQAIVSTAPPLYQESTSFAGDTLWNDPSIWSEEAEQAFARARRRAERESRRGRVHDGPAVLDLFEDATNARETLTPHDTGLRTVPISSIVGSVSKPDSFTRSFNPTSEASRARWKKIYAITHGLRGYEPIALYKLGDDYFVIDGHYRVSVVANLGGGSIRANVTEWR